MSDPKAERFASLYDAHFPRLVAYCRRRVDAHAVDDLVADVFLAAWRRIDDAPPVDEALPWLYRIAYNTTANHWRGRHRRQRLRRARTRLKDAYEASTGAPALSQRAATEGGTA